MSGFNCVSRTNYFHVKDADAFSSFMQTVKGDGCEIELWRDSDGNGGDVFCFGCFGYILGVEDCVVSLDAPDYFDVAYEQFVAGLQAHVTDGDAIVLIELGHEKLNFLRSAAVVITSNSVVQTDFMTALSQMGKDRVGTDTWTLQMNIPG